MSITNRLSVFLLVALALVLSGFSATIYGLASWHLHAQLDRHLAAAMETLIAAVEVHRENVTWEPHERHVVLGIDPDLSQVRWTLYDENDQLIDCSQNLADPTSAMLPTTSADWRQMVRRMRADNFTAEIPAQLPSQTTAESISQLPAKQQAFKRATLTLCVALSEIPLRESLNNLLMALLGVSLSIWATATMGGRWLCRRALLPISQMADKARALQQTPEHQGLLDVSDNQDELTELGNAFNQLIFSLRESIERQQRFAGDASHQLRTPLAAMLVAVDVATRQRRSSEEYENVLATVQRRGRDLQQIVETLLALARSKSPGLAIESEEFDLNGWCRAHLETWAGHRRTGDMELRLSPEPLVVYLPKSLLAQIVDNLLDNACKYGANGTPILIKTWREAESAYLSIQDHGQGISTKDMEQLFDPFFRTAEARSSGEPGFGLGLTLSKRLGTVFGGSLEARSIKGEGSEFILQLPLVSREQAPEVAWQELLDPVKG
jgi:signal transduction histidine kinase